MKNKYYWFCPYCKQEIGSYNVTFEENCAICGYPVEIRDINIDKFNEAKTVLWNEIVKTFKLVEILDWIELKLRRLNK